MTTYLNTSLETYKQFVELSKKMAEDFLKEYNLLHGDKSVRVEKDEHNGDELIINPENEAGVTAYVEIEERINVEELYKNVVRSIAENVFGTLSRFDFEKEFQEDWNETFEEESDLTADEYEKKLYTAQEDFENKSFIIEIEDGDYVHFKKHKILDSYEHIWNKKDLGVVIENIFSIDAHVAFYESENMTEKAVQLLTEHLEKRKVQEEEHHKKVLEDIEKLKKDLKDKSFKK